MNCPHLQLPVLNGGGAEPLESAVPKHFDRLAGPGPRFSAQAQLRMQYFSATACSLLSSRRRSRIFDLLYKLVFLRSILLPLCLALLCVRSLGKSTQLESVWIWTKG